jgi:hypothetical protein
MRRSLVGLVVFLACISTVMAQDAAKEPSTAGSKAASKQDRMAMPPKGPEMANPQPKEGWWSDRDAGWIGGIGGSAIGLMGAVIGLFAGMGKLRRFVLALTAFSIGLGILCLLLGLIALTIGQPYAVYYPLLLLGVILTLVCSLNYPGIRNRYQQIELRKMAAMDAGFGKSQLKGKP